MQRGFSGRLYFSGSKTNIDKLIIIYSIPLTKGIRNNGTKIYEK